MTICCSTKQKASIFHLRPSRTPACSHSMGRLRAKIDYENLRNARISENQARFAALGLEKSAGELRSIISAMKSIKTPVRKYVKAIYDTKFLRRSSRLNGESSDPLLSLPDWKQRLSEPTRRRLSRKRNSVYGHALGICCHLCRQRRLCGEEDCKRCENGEVDETCIGKTDCSVCHSANGIFCRGCLKVRYGEEMEEVRKNENWMCPHCIEAKGINPYWICNSYICLKKRNMAPAGMAIFEARMKGFKSVAHLLMDELKRKAEHVDCEDDFLIQEFDKQCS